MTMRQYIRRQLPIPVALPVVSLRPIDARASQKQPDFSPFLSIVAIVIAVSASGCATSSRVANSTTQLEVPVKFVDENGDTVFSDRPAVVVLGVTPGALFGRAYFLESKHIDPISTIALTTSELESQLNKQSSPITADAAQLGLRVDPSLTRFARLGTGIQYEDRPRGVHQVISFVDSASRKNLLAVFFDRPCRVTGSLKINSRQNRAIKFIFSVHVRRTGLTWLQISDRGDGTQVVTNSRLPVRPLFVIAPVENLRQELIQIR